MQRQPSAQEPPDLDCDRWVALLVHFVYACERLNEQASEVRRAYRILHAVTIAHLATQWPAVTTWRELINAPPHRLPPTCTKACHGNWPNDASVPPTMRLILLVLRPQSNYVYVLEFIHEWMVFGQQRRSCCKVVARLCVCPKLLLLWLWFHRQHAGICIWS